MTRRAGEKDTELPTFVARIWLEQGRGDSKSWRGRIHHVQGDQEAYFHSFEELRAFLEEVSGVPGPAFEAGGASQVHGKR